VGRPHQGSSLTISGMIGTQRPSPFFRFSFITRGCMKISHEILYGSFLAPFGMKPPPAPSRRPSIAVDARNGRQLIGFPRHLSQHPGGLVLTRDRLDELVPIEPAAMAASPVIERTGEFCSIFSARASIVAAG
jgi:hypothetical protein